VLTYQSVIAVLALCLPEWDPERKGCSYVATTISISARNVPSQPTTIATSAKRVPRFAVSLLRHGSQLLQLPDAQIPVAKTLAESLDLSRYDRNIRQLDLVPDLLPLSVH
jgi:hypothetical protein